MSHKKSSERLYRIALALKRFFINPYTISYIGITAALYIIMLIVYHSENSLGMKTPFDAFWFFCVTFIAGYAILGLYTHSWGFWHALGWFGYPATVY